MRARTVENYDQRVERLSMTPLTQNSRGFYILVFSLLAVIAWGTFAYVTQLRYGLRMTGMNDMVSWGFYIFNFVFWIGVSHVGALISAILRLTHAGWRTPITRLGELVTISALMIGGLMIFIDLGRPDRVLNLILYGRFQSPLIWDVIGVTTYLIGSFTYLYIPLIPDFAHMRDRLGRGATGFKARVYTLIAAGWTGTPEQRVRLDRAHKIMTVMIIPVAISVHTVVSFVFALTLRPGWDATALAPNFVIGALFSGMGSLLVIMAIYRKVYHLEEYITPRHFRNMSYLVGVLLFTYFYFVITEYITIGYKFRIEEKHLFSLLLTGANAIWFWAFFILAFIVPTFLIYFNKGSVIFRTATAGILINVAMWIKRFVIIIPSLKIPQIPLDFEFGVYTPSWVEISIVIAGFAGFALLMTLFTKLIPNMPFAELIEENEEEEYAEAPQLSRGEAG